MDYSVVVVNIVEIFAMIGVGFAAGKFGVVSEKLSSELSSLLISVTLPASIFASMLREFDLALLENSILILCPVSYTHLDVYKRQAWRSLTRKNVWPAVLVRQSARRT